MSAQNSIPNWCGIRDGKCPEVTRIDWSIPAMNKEDMHKYQGSHQFPQDYPKVKVKMAEQLKILCILFSETKVT